MSWCGMKASTLKHGGRQASVGGSAGVLEMKSTFSCRRIDISIMSNSRVLQGTAMWWGGSAAMRAMDAPLSHGSRIMAGGGALTGLNRAARRSRPAVGAEQSPLLVSPWRWFPSG
jgi:hypothetical protein